ncbi:MAG: hypothetical protein R3C11_29500 [Planctomycetaceae bacterium]
MGTIVLVHGTGVRLPDYYASLRVAEKTAREAGITSTFLDCAWGDPLGINFEGKSIPNWERLPQIDEADAKWEWLLADPYWEIEHYATSDSEQNQNPPSQHDIKNAKQFWKVLSAYKPSLELSLMLERFEKSKYWEPVWSEMIDFSGVPKRAVSASAEEMPEVGHAIARAIVARLHSYSIEKGDLGLDHFSREQLVDRLRRLGHSDTWDRGSGRGIGTPRSQQFRTSKAFGDQPRHLASNWRYTSLFIEWRQYPTVYPGENRRS